ncbi:hypothetical protein Golax_010363 [Gossypium laxum]|uniref:Uncharacterized protein n=1 Tax=Gossypium laxum TaxID=34288 RepID=A0A7J8ZHG6_9ROSI|nr:hypothetical protein [Gossypium laxum]
MASIFTDSVFDGLFFQPRRLIYFLIILITYYGDNKYFLPSRLTSSNSFLMVAWVPNDDGVLHENSDFARYEQQDSKGRLIDEGFLMKINNYGDNLTSCGEVIGEHEHVTVILNGLSSKFEVVVTLIIAS